ncbi:hypothetical protein [Micromonospora rosaria]|uniref:hypothetical protein n=1 Tax=Micromonospora rosaria TaxID=47874 RepID=UPI000B25B7AB|nr:hypothetical protein [Micromonospora rosaria]
MIDEVTDEGERILVRARTPEGVVACPGCAAGATIKKIQDTLGHSSYKLTADTSTSSSSK